MYDYYDYGYGYGALIASMAQYIVIFAVLCIALWKIFKKAGRHGWAALIPFYNMYVLFDIVWGKGIKFLMLLIPIYNIILSVKTMLRLAKEFGKSTGFGVGLIFLSPIFLLILGFGKAEYIGVEGLAYQTADTEINEVHTNNNPVNRISEVKLENEVQHTEEAAEHENASKEMNIPVQNNISEEQSVQETTDIEKPVQKAADIMVPVQQVQPTEKVKENPKEEQKSKIKFCSQCGKRLEGGKFCPNCGAPINR